MLCPPPVLPAGNSRFLELLLFLVLRGVMSGAVSNASPGCSESAEGEQDSLSEHDFPCFSSD